MSAKVKVDCGKAEPLALNEMEAARAMILGESDGSGSERVEDG